MRLFIGFSSLKLSFFKTLDTYNFPTLGTKIMYEGKFPKKRYKHTLRFLNEVISKEGFNVTNSSGEDLDLETNIVKTEAFDVVTAFEIFEHLVSPFNVLKDIQAKKMVASIPLKLWFASAYRSKTDKWDRHYHEFEDWQFDWLLEKAGWRIVKSLQIRLKK